MVPSLSHSSIDSQPLAKAYLSGTAVPESSELTQRAGKTAAEVDEVAERTFTALYERISRQLDCKEIIERFRELRDQTLATRQYLLTRLVEIALEPMREMLSSDCPQEELQSLDPFQQLNRLEIILHQKGISITFRPYLRNLTPVNHEEHFEPYF